MWLVYLHVLLHWWHSAACARLFIVYIVLTRAELPVRATTRSHELSRRHVTSTFPQVRTTHHLFIIFLLYPTHHLRPSFSLPPNRNSDHPGSNTEQGSPPPSPSPLLLLHFYRENTSALSSVDDSRQSLPTHATNSQ